MSHFHPGEEGWLKNQLMKFDQEWNQINCGNDLLKEVLMFKYDVPLSKSFMVEGMRVLNERYRRILFMHSEFEAMDAATQRLLWIRNIEIGRAHV